MQDPGDDGRRGVEKSEMGFQSREVRGGGGERGPEEGVVVGEEREQDAEKEGCGCGTGGN